MTSTATASAYSIPRRTFVNKLARRTTHSGWLTASLVAMLLATALAADPARAAGILPANGELYTIATPLVTPPPDLFWLLRVKPSTGDVDTVVKLPTGVGVVDMDCSPTSGLVYVLSQSTIYRVDPCTGIIATIATGGFVGAPQPPLMNLLAHSDGNLYVTRSGAAGGVIRIDPVSGAQSLVANPFPALGSSPRGLTEGPDHMLYVSTSGGSGVLPWVVKVDPVTGASTTVATGAQATNVLDIAFDNRDSLFVLREGGFPSVHRIDRVAGQVGLLSNLVGVSGATFGWMAALPSGGLYTPQTSTDVPKTAAIYVLDPIGTSFTTVTTPQSVFAFETIAVSRGFHGCPTPVHTSTWGQLKSRYR